MRTLPCPVRRRARTFYCHAIACAFLLSLALLAVPVSAQPSGAMPLSLDEALTLARDQAPQLAARAAAIDAAQSEAIRAPQLPDPQLIAGIDNLPVDTADRFSLTDDFMTMRKIGLMQTFPRKEKRRLRGERANAVVDREDALLTAGELDVRRKTALAWIECALAEHERALLVELRNEMTLQVAAAKARLKGGTGSAADALAARSAEVELEDRLDDADRRIAQARATLARWVGSQAAARTLADPPDFSTLPQSAAALLDHVDQYGAIRPYDAMERAAQTDVALARVEKKPDWSVQVAYAQRGPRYSNMVSVEFSIGLPLFPGHRQDPEIAAKAALLDQVQADHADAERAAREETRKTLAAWQSACKRVHRYEQEILPLARDRAAVALAAYRGGRGDLQPVLVARDAEIASRLAYVDQLGARDHAWAALAYLLPTGKQP